MKIRYLGTAASEGWPAFFCECDLCREAARRGGRDLRYRACALVDDDLLLDVSPDLYAAKVRFDVDLAKVRKVLITHSHGDHFAVQQLHWYAPHFASIQARAPLRIYGSAATGEKHRELERLFPSRFIEGWIEYHALVPFRTEDLGDTLVTLFPAEHGAEGASVYLVERGGKRLLYLHDTGGLSAETWQFLKNRRCDLVSLDATGGPNRAAEGSGHMSFEQDIEIKARLVAQSSAHDATIWVSNHMCIHAMAAENKGRAMFHEDMVRLMAPQGFTVAYDGLSIQL